MEMMREKSRLRLSEIDETLSLRSRWLCRLCGKFLSSKRSFDEHCNIHNRSRPFSCDSCDYAAASQMTLRRHKLRNHTPRQAWGYQCPHCNEAYMEPASYQQHVLSRHFGRSATFGCPFEGCQFQTKCCRHFRDHYNKHTAHSEQRKNLSTRSQSFARFLIDDEIGCGYGKKLMGQLSRRNIVRNGSISLCPIPSNLITKPGLVWRPMSRSVTVMEERKKNDVLKERSGIDGVDWIATVVEVDSTEEGPQRLPDGQMDIDLD